MRASGGREMGAERFFFGMKPLSGAALGLSMSDAGGGFVELLERFDRLFGDHFELGGEVGALR